MRGSRSDSSAAALFVGCTGAVRQKFYRFSDARFLVRTHAGAQPILWYRGRRLPTIAQDRRSEFVSLKSTRCHGSSRCCNVPAGELARVNSDVRNWISVAGHARLHVT
jgi:hypothetical protein